MAPGTSIYMDFNSVSWGLEDEGVIQQVGTSTLIPEHYKKCNMGFIIKYIKFLRDSNDK